MSIIPLFCQIDDFGLRLNHHLLSDGKEEEH